MKAIITLTFEYQLPDDWYKYEDDPELYVINHHSETKVKDPQIVALTMIEDGAEVDLG